MSRCMTPWSCKYTSPSRICATYTPTSVSGNFPNFLQMLCSEPFSQNLRVSVLVGDEIRRVERAYSRIMYRYSRVFSKPLYLTMLACYECTVMSTSITSEPDTGIQVCRYALWNAVQ